LYAKLDESHAHIKSLEVDLKFPIATSCSSCEVTPLKNIDLAHYVDRLKNKNDQLWKMMGWLSSHEPQLRMMIEAYKSYDGQALGSEKVVESSGEKEGKICDISTPPQTFHKNTFSPKPNPLRSN
jgi:hypothetical protein